MPSRAWVVTFQAIRDIDLEYVSMPSRAWVVTLRLIEIVKKYDGVNALTGLSCYFILHACECIS